MKRIVAFFVILCLTSVGCVRQDRKVFVAEFGHQRAEFDPLQWNLARWYNLNLHAEKPDPGFRETYRDIVAMDGDVMGYAEFPAREMILPICHDGAVRGLVHSAQSDFPVGGIGNHTVLTCWEPLRLQQGEEIVICILGEQLHYRRGERSQDIVTLVCGNASYTLGRVVEN